jgi:hypothetical protein
MDADSLCDNATALGDATKETSCSIIMLNPGDCPSRTFQVNSVHVQCINCCAVIVATDLFFH